jgi:hypothetical protein
VLRATAWIAASAAVLELCAREIARRSIMERLFGYTPGSFALVLVIAAVALALSYPSQTEPARPDRRPALLFLALFALGLAFQLQLGARLQSDGFYYFAYLRSLAFDGDVDFTNDYKLLGLDDKPHLFAPTPTGHAQSAASIGPAILWAPFFGAGHLVARPLAARHPDINANGISFPYRQAVCVAGLFYGLIGCWFCFRLTRRFYGTPLAALAVTLTVAGSFLLWYLVKEPSMTHGPSMAAVAGFAWAWIATRDARMRASSGERSSVSGALLTWAWLGALAGFMTLIRWQNALFAVLPAIDAIGLLISAVRTSDTGRARRVIINGAVFTGCAALAFIPQMIAWRSIYGSWLAVSPLGPQIRWFDPQLVDILWSSRNGLLSWSPILYVGAIGFAMFVVRRPAIGAPMLLAVLLMTYFNACIQDWWGSDGFGGRRFDGTIPFFCLGVAAFASFTAGIVRRHPLRAVATAGGALVLWNLTLMNVANSGLFRLGTSVSFGDTAAAQGRAFHQWFGNPFAYPASLFFAVRNALPPARYDLLSANRFLGDPLRPYGRVDVGADDGWVLGEGWHGPEQEGATTFRWAASPATVLIPLDHSAPLLVQVRLHAFAYPGSAPQTLAISLNGHLFGPLAVAPGWETLEFMTGADAWRSGVNRLRFDFARALSPAQAGLSGDARPLAAAVDYVRVSTR